MSLPLYEYRCCACGKEFELLRRIGQGTEGINCPHCGESEVEKEYSTFAGSASGGGFSSGGCSSSGRFT
jgi:putative FmdB family regulatory protein